jgi:hypothetical protein
VAEPRAARSAFSLEERVNLLRCATLIHGLAQDVLLHEPSEAELVALERELLRRGRQFIAILEGRFRGKDLSGKRVIDLLARQRMRALLEALGSDPTPPPAAA